MRRLLSLLILTLTFLSACAPTPTYQNPVYAGDFPDPFVLRVGNTYYAYATNTSGKNVPVLRAEGSLAQWSSLGDALPRLPAWAATGQSLTWAPAVLPRGEGYVLYYTAHSIADDTQCIGSATASQPQGPYQDDSHQPLVCQIDLGGSIDPSPFVDADGKAYLYWKNDGNSRGTFSALWVQPLSEDGLSLTGQPVELIRRDQAWELPTLEGPAMLLYQNTYYLFYSAGSYDNDNYAMGYAICQTVTGPCQKGSTSPWVASQGNVRGPGGGQVFTDPQGRLWMAYHAWTLPNIGYPNGARSFRIDRLTFKDGKPVLDGPSEGKKALN